MSRQPIVDVAMEPAPDASRGPVVDVVLVRNPGVSSSGCRNHGESVRCTDCDREFINRPDETGALCDECCDERDAHTSALEIRMAKARLSSQREEEVA